MEEGRLWTYKRIRLGRLRIKRREKVWANNIQEALIGKRYLEISLELAQMLQENRDRFIEKFGREPGPGDPVFFDPDSDSPEPVPITENRLLQELTDACKKAGFDDEKIKGFFETLWFSSRLKRLEGEVAIKAE